MAFKIHNSKKFAQMVMPKYFSHSKYSSFQRQLLIYGFRYIKDKDSAHFGSFYHELFRRGKSNLCLQMTRQKIKGRKKTLVKKGQASGKKMGDGGGASSAHFIPISIVSCPVVPPIVSSPPLVMAQHECDRGHPVSLDSSNNLIEDASPRPLAITSNLSIMEWASWYSSTDNPIAGNETEGRDEDRIDEAILCCREEASSFEGKRFFFVTDY
jgi:hypothetical protein